MEPGPAIVLDTNLLVAFFNKSSCSLRIIEMAEKEEAKILWTKQIKNEAVFS